MEEEKKDHEAKMQRMEKEMEQVFEMKVREKMQKLKESEADLQRRHEQMKKGLEQQKLELEDKRRNFDKEKASFEMAHRDMEDVFRKMAVDSNSKDLGLLFQDSPAGRKDSSMVTEETFPLKYVAHCWVENIPVTERAPALWPDVAMYIESARREEQKGSLQSCHVAAFLCCENGSTSFVMVHHFPLAKETNQTNQPKMGKKLSLHTLQCCSLHHLAHDIYDKDFLHVFFFHFALSATLCQGLTLFPMLQS
ncbi:hypothetical protein HPB51_023932 [Rhipicephalus microplus]|uniref:Uncharacterized protein n=1 Tax=Rhipicephalus microplus TaxID=6941 RepID=A0A9J6DDM8_RHIMP|nr:hypothetical protein HPB51_023932 [Rhipicephalus microplus]